MNQEKVLVVLIEVAAISISVLILESLMPGKIGLGSETTAGSFASVVLAFASTLGFNLFPSLLKRMDLKIEDVRYLAIIYLVVFIPFLWVWKKIAFITGVGVSHNYFLVVLSGFIVGGHFLAGKISSELFKKIE